MTLWAQIKALGHGRCSSVGACHLPSGVGARSAPAAEKAAGDPLSITPGRALRRPDCLPMPRHFGFTEPISDARDTPSHSSRPRSTESITEMPRVDAGRDRPSGDTKGGEAEAGLGTGEGGRAWRVLEPEPGSGCSSKGPLRILGRRVRHAVPASGRRAVRLRKESLWVTGKGRVVFRETGRQHGG